MMGDERQSEGWTVAGAPPGCTADPAAADGSVDADVDELAAWLQAQVSAEARRAQTMYHVEQVARHVDVLRRHRPLDVEILTASGPDGGDVAHEVGFHTVDGAYISLQSPRVLCSAHDTTESWPCADIRALAAHYRGRQDGADPA